MRTPWGTSQESTPFGDGIVFHSTAGHGGFKLDKATNAQVPELWRVPSGWYEEDVDALIVGITFNDRDQFADHDADEMRATLAKYAGNGWFAGQYLP